MHATRMTIVCLIGGLVWLATAEAQTGLIGCWDFEEGSGTVAADCSGTGRLYLDDICVTKP